MDEYIDQLLAEMQMHEPAQKVGRNILDEPIPKTVKRRLRKPLFPKKDLPPRPPPTWKNRESKTILEQFDPLPPQMIVRTIQDYQREILEVFEEKQEKRHGQIFYRTPWTIGKFLRGLQVDVPAEHRLAADPREFFAGVRQRIHEKLTEEILALDGVKFQLALKVSLHTQGPDGTEEFTDPVLRHKQKTLLQAKEIKEALYEAIPHLLELLEKWAQRGSGWVVDQVQTFWLDIASISATERQVLLPTSGSRKVQEGSCQCEKHG